MAPHIYREHEYEDEEEDDLEMRMFWKEGEVRSIIGGVLGFVTHM